MKATKKGDKLLVDVRLVLLKDGELTVSEPHAAASARGVAVQLQELVAVAVRGGWHQGCAVWVTGSFVRVPVRGSEAKTSK